MGFRRETLFEDSRQEENQKAETNSPDIKL